jgi:tubulin gamma
VLHFVSQADDDLYIPRSILIDLEPRVIQGILDGPQKSLYNRENIYMGTNGAGAGNLWSAGYFRETKEMDKILDMINREADNSDSLEV